MRRLAILLLLLAGCGPLAKEPADAGEPDAATSSDAGESDAGALDAGESDAGALDAGESDAGALDAGESDEGELDAGALDAGESDAGESDAGESDAGESDAGAPSLGEFSAAQLHESLNAKDFLMLDVHVPRAGVVPGTDASITWTDIDGLAAAIGPSLARKVVLTCLSGHMSEQAGHALIARGYSAVSELTGGMNAWVAAGYTLDP